MQRSAAFTACRKRLCDAFASSHGGIIVVSGESDADNKEGKYGMSEIGRVLEPDAVFRRRSSAPWSPSSPVSAVLRDTSHHAYVAYV